MALETMQPNPAWNADAHTEAVAAFESVAEEITVRVWGGDWCTDCRSQLPDFGAALAAAGVPEERIVHYAVEKADDGSKVGPEVETYDIELIPTVVLERDGEEIARFVEEEPVPIATYLADELNAAATET